MELNECFYQHLLKRANSGGERGEKEGYKKKKPLELQSIKLLA